jgi:hypothetical protein
VDEYREKLIARDFICELVKREWFSKYRIIDIVYDSLGSADSTGGEGFRSFGDIVNEVLKDKGLGRARATTYSEKNDEDFIERIRDSLVVGPQGIPKLRFYTRCPGSYEDVRTVKWYEDKQIRENRAKLDIRQKDFLSCIKYGLATNLFYTKPERSRPHYVTKPVYGTQTKSQKKLRTSWKRYL